MILIRNRQKNISKPTPEISEKNAGGYVSEDINQDGTSIHITSGLTESSFNTTCKKKIFQDPSLSKEEVPAFSPPGCTKFRPPILTGDQIVINSDRIIVSSRNGETIHYSKKRYGIVTDNEYTVDSHGQIVMTTNTKTVINSPSIYLGQYDQTNEPALLGQTTVDFLYDLADLILDHVHWQYHEHITSATNTPADQSGQLADYPTQLTTQIATPQEKLKAWRDSLDKILSKRVFLTGGGYAPGRNGGSIEGGSPPTEINVFDGSGVPGGYNGKTRGPNPSVWS